VKTLDLHGVKHEDVEAQVVDFTHKNEAPFRIITGNSQRMKTLVTQVLTRFKLDTYVESDYNLGALIVVDGLPDGFTHIRKVF
jgi:hypothetical protein